MSLTWEDKLEIIELHARYNRAVDTGADEEWAACFTDDGVFDARSRYARGTEELREFAREFHEQATFQGAVHWNANILIDGDGDDATGHADYALIRADPSGGRILSTGSYASMLRKVNGRWLFSERKSTVTGAADELLATFTR